jgi:predicted HTH transcriptional regulator
MNQEEYRQIIYAGSEERNREYKQSFPWVRSSHGRSMAKVAKSILAMSNLSDGGHIVIGVQEVSEMEGRYELVGVQSEHLETYSSDTIADFVRSYADPYAKLDSSVVSFEGLDFVVISVSSFDETPVICKRSYANILSEGVIYIRSRSGRPRSEPVTLYADMRKLMDLAVDRGVQSFLRRQSRIGAYETDDTEEFDKQLEDFS